MKRLCNLFFILMTTSFIHAQEISGHIYSTETPIEWANITLLTGESKLFIDGTTSDSLGFFTFNIEGSHQFVLQISHLNYKDTIIKIHNLNFPLRVNLRPNQNELSTVVISSRKPRVSFKNGTLSYDVSHINNSADNGLELLENVPLVRLDKDDNLLVRNKSVKVLINGKDQLLGSAEVTAFLKTLNGDQIEKVEVITNPSTKYDAEGTGGIINIMLKSFKTKQLTNLMLFAGHGRFGKIGGGISSNLNFGKFAIAGSFYPSHGKSFNLLTIDRTDRNTGYNYQQTNEWLPESDYFNTNLSVNMELSKIFNLSAFVKSNKSYSNEKSHSKSHIQEALSFGSNIDKLGSDNWDRWTIGSNFETRLDTNGQKITFEFLNVSAQNSAAYTQENLQHFSNTENTSQFGQNSFFDYQVNSFRIDYEKPINDKFLVEAGLKYSAIEMHSQINFMFDESSTNFILIPLSDNTFEYSEKITAAYINTEFEFESITIQGGLRLEQTSYEIFSTSAEPNLSSKIDYLDLFPNVSINKSIKDGFNISISYSRRLSRPSYRALNPALDILDQYSYDQGNPFLQPEYSNNFDLDLQMGDHILSFYSHFTSDVEDDVLFNSPTPGVIISKPFNLNKTTDIGMDYSTSFDLSKYGWIDIDFYGAYAKTKHQDEEIELDIQNLFWGTRTAYEKEFAKYFTFNLNAFYSSGGLYGIYKNKANYGVGSSITYKKGNLNLNLKIRDIFDTSRWNSIVDYENIEATWVNRWESRRVYLTVRFQFGMKEAKGKGGYKGNSYSKESGRI